MHKQSRPAKVADKLTTHNFNSGTIGFRDIADTDGDVAVCLLPGTELAFDEEVRSQRWCESATVYNKVAIFRQVQKDVACTHHDAFEFPDGKVVLLTTLVVGQKATVLQLPAAPKTEQEEKDQTRLEIVA